MKNILEKILKKEPIIEYITTGDDDLDKKILGYQKGELITIASRPGSGKTALALKSVIANSGSITSILNFIFSFTMTAFIISSIFSTDQSSILSCCGVVKSVSLKPCFSINDLAL